MADPTSGGRRFVRPEHWRRGAPAPWEPPVHPPSLADISAIVARTSAGQRPVSPAHSDARVSAVLVALDDGDRGAQVLLTRRSTSLRSHSGDVSLPGGRIDPGETVVEAALREAYEEVALDPEAVSVLGELEHVSTFTTGSYIVPVVGALARPVELVAHEAEVARIFWTPLVELARPGVFREEWWPYDGGERSVMFFEVAEDSGGELVWGATARILHHLLRVVFAPAGQEAGAAGTS